MGTAKRTLAKYEWYHAYNYVHELRKAQTAAWDGLQNNIITAIAITS